MEEYKNRKLKVLMTADTVGGVWTYAMELCRAMDSHDVFFYLVTMGSPLNDEQKTEAKALLNVEVIETGYVLEWMQEPWRDIDNSGRWLLQMEKELRPDIIHLNSYAYGALHWQAPVVIVAHSDVYSWWHAVNSEDPPITWNEYYKRVQAGLSGADYVIAPSASVMKQIQEIYGLQRKRQVVYNARSDKMFFKKEKQPYIFTAGRIWDKAKNISLLVEAANNIPYQVKIAGDNKYDDCQYGITSEHVVFMGRINTIQMASTLSEATIYVLPAKYEPFGLSVLEAALSGCVLVLGNIDSLREIWKDSAIYVDTDNAVALSATVNWLMENESLRRQYAERAYLHAQKYSVQRMIEQYFSVYNQLLKQKKSTFLKQNIPG